MPSNSNFRRDRALEQKEAAKKATEAEKNRQDALEKKLRRSEWCISI